MSSDAQLESGEKEFFTAESINQSINQSINTESAYTETWLALHK